jgi:hypothetical protein
MIALDSVIIGALIGLLRGGAIGNLAKVQLRYEMTIAVLFATQMALPRVAELGGLSSTEAVAAWLAVMGLLVLAAGSNWRSLGMALATLGIACNALVIGVNCGMPVSLKAVETISGQVPAADVLADDLVHVPLDSDTRLVALADVIAFPGPAWHRSVISIGDVLLALGVCVFIVRGMATPSVSASGRSAPTQGNA